MSLCEPLGLEGEFGFLFTRQLHSNKETNNYNLGAPITLPWEVSAL
jgi:hypothetical protein